MGAILHNVCTRHEGQHRLQRATMNVVVVIGSACAIERFGQDVEHNVAHGRSLV